MYFLQSHFSRYFQQPPTITYVCTRVYKFETERLEFTTPISFITLPAQPL